MVAPIRTTRFEVGSNAIPTKPTAQNISRSFRYRTITATRIAVTSSSVSHATGSSGPDKDIAWYERSELNRIGHTISNTSFATPLIAVNREVQNPAARRGLS